MKGKRCLYPRICLLLLAKEFEEKNQTLKMSENRAIYIGFYAYAGLYYRLGKMGRFNGHTPTLILRGIGLVYMESTTSPDFKTDFENFHNMGAD